MREKFNGLSVAIGMIFSRLPLTPNHWTMLSFVPAAFAFYFISSEQFLLGAFFFGVAGFLDFVDGSVARVTGRATKFGAYLDTVADRYVEFFVVAGLFFAGLPSLNFGNGIFLPAQFLLFVYLFGSLMTTYVKAAAKEKELVQKEIRGGLFERAERLGLLCFGLLLASLNVVFLVYVLAFLALMTNISALQRILIARKNALA